MIRLSVQQQKCVEFCLNHPKPLIAVTGAAGTGKTTIIKHLSEQLTKSFAVAAPTGKAAKRIHEATGIHAVTIHRLLEYGRPRERDLETGEPTDPTLPNRGKSNPLDEWYILVDEYSMVNHVINRNLIDAMRKGAKMIMFGDVAQLSPIEPYEMKNKTKSPFMEHLERTDCVFVLDEVFRQSEESDVLRAAVAIRKGIVPRRGEGFKMHMSDQPVKTLKRLVTELGVDFSSINNQILTPVRIRWIGTDALNTMLRNHYNPHGTNAVKLMRYEWSKDKKVTVSVGDKVVCTENTYDMRHYSERYASWKGDKPDPHSYIPVPETKYMLNGETGIVREIYPDTGMEVDFGDRLIEIPYYYEEKPLAGNKLVDMYPQRAIDLAYALTTHKAQGSEYDTVIYVISKTISFMLSRENFYTAVTRAKHSAHVITDSAAMTTSLRVTRDVINLRNAARAKRSMLSDEVSAKLKKG